MAVDFFLIDAPHVVPEEFSAWEAAKKQRHEIFLRACDASDQDEIAALDVQARALKEEEDGLKKVAYAAWEKKLKATAKS